MISAETLTQGGVVAVIGICTVFAVLAILWGVLELMRVAFTAKKAPKKKAEAKPEPVVAPAAPAATAEDEGELIAVLTAAVACCLGKPASSLNIRSYRRIDSGTPIWNKSARRDNLV